MASSWSTPRGFREIKKALDKEWTNEEIADDWVKHIESGLNKALINEEFGPGQSVQEFLNRHQDDCNKDDLYWEEAESIENRSRVYQWVLRYLNSCRRICLRKKGESVRKGDTNDPNEAIKLEWETLADFVNQLVELLWPKYGVRSLFIISAMGGKSK